MYDIQSLFIMLYGVKPCVTEKKKLIQSAYVLDFEAEDFFDLLVFLL